MTHEELIAIIKEKDLSYSHPDSVFIIDDKANKALRAVVELHKPFDFEIEDGTFEKVCKCQWGVIGDRYPCPTIRAIEIKLS